MKPEEGVITGWNSKVVFVMFDGDNYSVETKRAHLQWV